MSEQKLEILEQENKKLKLANDKILLDIGQISFINKEKENGNDLSEMIEDYVVLNEMVKEKLL